ncbi:iron chelate uptake ABC transporter family permease subunit [Paenibacillus hemerocallicola]|uniref:Iron chelate uptake ABC transporter family permease subunit n=1 Tax=Paenibacillus hemerocallicola TaxID=1172614 RepID=A0A5C4T0J2_9BACL|nr:iron chelate uptake ABC transporter family permease subunit [Paenibacillus hemerocallicola]TNJ62628.1 iron chelate uptake ABC transporter family permease subunit [Paenibacillus hemerocallicola]
MSLQQLISVIPAFEQVESRQTSHTIDCPPGRHERRPLYRSVQAAHRHDDDRLCHPTDINTALLWMSGSLWGRGWDDAISLLPWIAVLLPIAWLNFRKLDLFQLGDESTASLGLSLTRHRFWLLLLAVALAGISVSAVGAIGFIGLIAPHIARSLVGARARWLIPLASLVGADLMLLGDCLGRILIVPREVPVGIMTAVLGAPYFVYLLRRERRRSYS